MGVNCLVGSNGKVSINQLILGLHSPGVTEFSFLAERFMGLTEAYEGIIGFSLQVYSTPKISLSIIP